MRLSENFTITARKTKMAQKAKVMVLRTAGTNCDAETVFAFHDVGADAELVHVNQLFSGEKKLKNYHILALPGGFTYGDDIAAGKILANELRLRLGDELKQFIADGKLMIGICNGFQIMVKAGILPGSLNGIGREGNGFEQTATLTTNDCGKFEDRWIHLKPSGRCVWTQEIAGPIYLPVAHGEGKFLPKDDAVLSKLNEGQRIVFRYCSPSGGKPDYPDNPNGSADDIAGICDATGHVFGLMPHPERHFLTTQHPCWTRLKKKSKYGDGAKIFENGVRYAKEKFL